MSFNKNIYNVDWRTLALWLVPPILRKAKFMALINALYAAYNDLHTRLLYYRSGVLYRLKITPQVCHLERALNDRYDVIQRRIRIADGVERNPLPLFIKSEGKPVVLARKSEDRMKILYTKAETALFTSDFIVNIPVTIDFDVNELTAFLNTYKLASKTFKVRVV